MLLQVMRQYPSSFEFTGHYLERLIEGVYSAAFLNFAGVVGAHHCSTVGSGGYSALRGWMGTPPPSPQPFHVKKESNDAASGYTSFMREQFE